MKQHSQVLASSGISGTLAMFTYRFGLILLAGSIMLAQDSSQKQQSSSQQNSPQQKTNEPAPLFGGKLGTRSSQKTRESATLGFNGIDPSGKVDAKMLATSATSEHEAKVKRMAESAPTPADLEAFIKDGGLKKR